MNEKRRDSRTVIFMAALFFAVLGAVGVRQVAGKRRAVELGYELTALSKKVRVLEEEKRRLRLERSVLTSPSRLQRLASSLGLRGPGPEQMVFLEVGAELSALWTAKVQP